MKRFFGLGCLVVILLSIAATVFFYKYGPSLAKRAGRKIWSTVEQKLTEVSEEFERKVAFEEHWRPPTDPAAPGIWIPEKFGSWQATTKQEEQGGIARLNIATTGWHGVYQGNGAPVEVNVIKANDLEAEALQNRARDAIKKGNFTSSSGVSNRMTMNGEGQFHLYLWYVKGYQFIFQTDGPTDLEKFGEEYMTAINSNPEPFVPPAKHPKPGATPISAPAPETPAETPGEVTPEPKQP